MIDILKKCYFGEKLQNDGTKKGQINIKWTKRNMVNVLAWSVNVLILMYLRMW